MASTPGAHPLSPYQLQHIHESQSPKIIGVSGMLIGVTIVAVAARFYARRVRKLPLKADDFLMIPAMVILSILKHLDSETYQCQFVAFNYRGMRL